MADCQHKNLKRLFVAGESVPDQFFLYGCTQCKETMQAALEGTVQAAMLRMAELRAAAEAEDAPQIPDHESIIARAVRTWESAGLNFGTWADMLTTGSVSEAIFTRQACSLGFQLGDVEQLLAALRSEPESPATE